MTNEEFKKTLYTMDLCEHLQIGTIEITRVPGGWIFSKFQETGTGNFQTSSVFVAYNNEYQD